MKKWLVLFIWVLVFQTPEEAWDWIAEVNARLYADGHVHIGCQHTRASDSAALAEILPEMEPVLLASETAASISIPLDELAGQP